MMIMNAEIPFLSQVTRCDQLLFLWLCFFFYSSNLISALQLQRRNRIRKRKLETKVRCNNANCVCACVREQPTRDFPPQEQNLQLPPPAWLLLNDPPPLFFISTPPPPPPHPGGVIPLLLWRFVLSLSRQRRDQDEPWLSNLHHHKQHKCYDLWGSNQIKQRMWSCDLDLLSPTETLKAGGDTLSVIGRTNMKIQTILKKITWNLQRAADSLLVKL